ncbi:PLD nuclease N-terminal domain-containing protein [Microbacterium sp. YY-01]|uniref:PLD nuclease N-terminal domain-containing protein n=1 Tax=Microbacterium sp. YY-01 TaxID=3421634 RepID=UPI003D165AA0
MPVVISVLTLVLMIVALIDVITRDDSQIRYLPKFVWILLVIILPFAGSLIWFLVGREWNGEGIRMPQLRPQTRGAAPHTPRPSQAPAAPMHPADTRSTEQQIADLDREIEEWRLRAELEKRKRELGLDGDDSTDK